VVSASKSGAISPIFIDFPPILFALEIFHFQIAEPEVNINVVMLLRRARSALIIRNWTQNYEAI